MKDLLQPTGNTPFEIATAKALSGQAHVRAAAALEELVLKIAECDKTIATWQEEFTIGAPTRITRERAIKALTERKALHKHLDDVAAVMLALFNLEA